jgi:hypothetical protein
MIEIDIDFAELTSYDMHRTRELKNKPTCTNNSLTQTKKDATGVLLLHYLARRLFLDFFANPSFNALIFFRGNLLPHLSVGRIATQDVSVEAGNRSKGKGHDFPQNIMVTQCNRSQHHIKDEPPNRVKQKTKVKGDHNTDEFELCFEAANKETTAGRVDSQNNDTNGGKCQNFNNLVNDRGTQNK